MRLSRLAVPSSLAVALLAAGCGGTKIKGSDAEQQIKAAGAAYTSVDCPDEIDAKAGYTFTCDAQTAAGTFVVTIKIDSVKDDRAHMTIVKATKKQ